MPSKKIESAPGPFGGRRSPLQVKPVESDLASNGWSWRVYDGNERLQTYSTKKEAVEKAKKRAKSKQKPGVNVYKTGEYPYPFDYSWVNDEDYRRSTIKYIGDHRK